MHTYHINVSSRVIRRDNTASSSYRHLFNIDCESHRYTEDGVRSILANLQKSYPEPQYHIELSRSSNTRTVIDIKGFVSAKTSKR